MALSHFWPIKSIISLDVDRLSCELWERCVFLQSDVCWGSPILASDIFQICLDNRAFMSFIMLHQLSFFECRHFFWTPMFSFVFFEHGQQEFLCSKFNVVCSPHVKTIPISVYQLHQPPRSNGIQGPKRWRESGGLFFYIYIIIYIYY